MRRLLPGLFLVLLGACGSSGSPAERTGAAAQPLVDVCPGPNRVQGIDVSHYQGTIDWAAQKAQGRHFGIASVGDGTYEDPTFATNWNAMKAAGVIRGAYQFFEPGGDPNVQADILIRKVGVLGDGDLPATLDVETTGGQSGATIAARIRIWSDKVEQATGRKPMIYTGPYFWEDNVGSSAFVANPLWVADYGPACPKLPAPWSTFKFWQYSDSNGTLDVDIFNGSLAELQAFARPPNTPPKGYLDTADCANLAGWAADEDAPTQAIAVHLYFNAAAGAAGAIGVPMKAGEHRADLCAPLGSCEHGFTLATPRGLQDGKPHEVFAYGIDEAGGANTLLTGSPKSFTCKPPAAPANMVKRWITNPASLGAWHFSTLDDLAHYDDTVFASFAKGPDLEAAPRVVIADDGSAAVWVVDGSERRHVVNPAAMDAWRFGAPAKWTAAKINALAKGRDWTTSPFLVQGSGPAVYVLDTPPPPASASGDGGAQPGPIPARDDGGATNSADPAGNGETGSGGGCSASGVAITGRPWTVLALAALALLRLLLSSAVRKPFMK